MKLFGPRSASYYIHLFFKIIYYLNLVLGVFFIFSLIMALIHHYGFSNPIASLEFNDNGFKIHYKLISSSPMFMPLKGINQFMQYAFTILFGFFIYIFSCKFLSQIFLSLSGKTIFVKNLVRGTKSLSRLLLFISGLKVFAMFFDSSQILVWSDWLLVLISGILIWFLSKVFEEGYKLQEELNLTI